MSNQRRVFLVVDSRFGIVFASLNLEEAAANLNQRVLGQLADEALANPGTFCLRSLRLEGSTNSEDHSASTKDVDPIKQLMQINAQMFEGTVKVLGRQNLALHEENAHLREKLSTVTATTPSTHL